MIHWLALAGHEFAVVALDGNPVPVPASTPAIRLGSAKRVDGLVTMSRPGIWILGETRESMRKAGHGYCHRVREPARKAALDRPTGNLVGLSPLREAGGDDSKAGSSHTVVFRIEIPNQTHMDFGFMTLFRCA